MTSPTAHWRFVVGTVCETLGLKEAEIEDLVDGTRHDMLPEVYWPRVAFLLALAEKLRRNCASVMMVKRIDWSRPPYKLTWQPGVKLDLKVDDYGDRPAARNPEVQALREIWLHPVQHDEPAAGL